MNEINYKTAFKNYENGHSVFIIPESEKDNSLYEPYEIRKGISSYGLFDRIISQFCHINNCNDYLLYTK